MFACLFVCLFVFISTKNLKPGLYLYVVQAFKVSDCRLVVFICFPINVLICMFSFNLIFALHRLWLLLTSAPPYALASRTEVRNVLFTQNLVCFVSCDIIWRVSCDLV